MLKILIASSRFLATLLMFLAAASPSLALQDNAATSTDVPPIDVPLAVASKPEEMKAYRELIEHTEAKIDMLPIPGGTFTMGSPDAEEGRSEAEGPQRTVQVSPFWMSKFEVTWDAYDVWASDLDIYRREQFQFALTPRDKVADIFQISQPTKPYTDMSFGMGKRGFPAICMTQHAARVFCKWLSAKTGRYYRLPTEAEWEYACRAGTTTAYSFGDDPAQLPEYGWFFDNTTDAYVKVGKKKPNPWGLYDMHGNVAEWVLDSYTDEGFVNFPTDGAQDPLNVPKTLYPRVVRGGGFNQPATACRSASREGSTEDWIAQDPQVPVSIWYLTDALHVGFRIVRPFTTPSLEEQAIKWDKSEPVQVERTTPKVE
jgi:formylglycine-generating enzyme required for sulfatase activity